MLADGGRVHLDLRRAYNLMAFIEEMSALEVVISSTLALSWQLAGTVEQGVAS